MPIVTRSVVAAALAAPALLATLAPSVTASPSPVLTVAGRPLVRAGHLAADSWSTMFTTHRAGDLEVVAVVAPLDHPVADVLGGGAVRWSPVRPSAVDRYDHRALQIWYATAAQAGRSWLTVELDGPAPNVYVAAQEFAADGATSWAVEASGRAPGSFPRLRATRPGVYVGLDEAAGRAVAGRTPGFSYLDRSGHEVFAVAAGVMGRPAPAARADATLGVVLEPGGFGGRQPQALLPPASLMPRSMFNQDVQTWPLSPSSAGYASDFVKDYQTDYGSVGINTLPLYSAPPGLPLQHLAVANGCNSFLPSTGTSVPVPAYAHLNGSGDNPLVVYQPSSGRDWELWKATPGPGGYEACWGGRLDMSSSNGVFPYNYGLSATGISYLATTITEADVASGAIDHAIGVILPRCDYSAYPADRGDCGHDPGQPPEGQWFRFPPQLAMPRGLTPFGRMVFTAVQTYGMVVVDQGGAVMLEAEQRADWAAEGHRGTDPITASWAGRSEYQAVADLPWGELQALAPPH